MRKESSKLISENAVYRAGVGYVIDSVKANKAATIAFNEGIDACISELETGENNVEISRLKKLKIII